MGSTTIKKKTSKTVLMKFVISSSTLSSRLMTIGRVIVQNKIAAMIELAVPEDVLLCKRIPCPFSTASASTSKVIR